MMKRQVTSRSEFGRYSQKALVEFVEKFALPSCSLIMSRNKAHEILAVIDRSERVKAAFIRRDMIWRQLKVLRAKASNRWRPKDYKRFNELMREDALISLRIARLIKAVESESGGGE